MTAPSLRPAVAIAAAATLISALALVAVAAPAQMKYPSPPAAPPAPPTPVLVELFTSEGCSSCPPADALLNRLARPGAVPGVEVIPLGFHVDYWDHLGWRDAASSATFTQRQQDYARHFPGAGTYTPQMVVNGTTQFVGSDEAKARAAIAQAASAPRLSVGITWGPKGASAGLIQRMVVTVSQPPGVSWAGEAIVWKVVLEKETVHRVTAGENAQRVLRHMASVRSLEKAGSLKAKPDGGITYIAHECRWPAEAQGVVVFIQETATGRILGCSSQSGLI